MTLRPSNLCVGWTLAGMAAGGFAHAQPAGQPAEQPAATAPVDDTITFELTLWGWLSGLRGDAGARGTTAHVEEGFTDITKDSDSVVTLAGRAEVGKGRWIGFLDGSYAKLGAEDQTNQGGGPPLDVDSTKAVLDFGAMYRVWEKESEGLQSGVLRSTSFDVYGGARYSYLELEVGPSGAGSKATSWVSPIVGGRVIVPLGQHWQLRGNADVGGFGLGCDLTWSTTALVGYDFRMFGNPATVFLGYRALGEDYSKGSGPEEFTWDMTMHGPIVGLSIQF